MGVLLRPGGPLGSHGQGCLEVTWRPGMALGPKASSSLVDYEKGTFRRDGCAHGFINAPGESTRVEMGLLHEANTQQCSLLRYPLEDHRRLCEQCIAAWSCI